MKRLTKEEIILAAVNVWGKNSFQDISLSPVCKELGISKPALYKYFRDKDELIAELHQHFFNATKQKLELDFLHKQEGFSGDILRLLVRHIASFFIESPQFVVFRSNLLLSQKIARKMEKEAEISPLLCDTLKASLKERGCDMKNFNSLFIHYLLDMIELWVSLQCGIGKNPGLAVELYPRETLLDVCVDEVIEMLEFGFFAEKPEEDLDFAKIEKCCRTGIKGLHVTDKVLDAIAKVILEDGPWGLSVSKIAQNTGMAKSSLYNYFENKNAMIFDSLSKNFNLVKECLFKVMNAQSGKWECWYTQWSFVFQILLNNINSVAIMNWLASQHFLVKDGKASLEMMGRIVSAKIPKQRKLFCGTPYFSLILLHMKIVRHVFFSSIIGTVPDPKIVRMIYKLSVFGINKEEL